MAERSLQLAEGGVLASTVAKNVAIFHAACAGAIDSAAELFALRARLKLLNVSVPPELAKPEVDLMIDRATADPGFPAAYRRQRDRMVAESKQTIGSKP